MGYPWHQIKSVLPWITHGKELSQRMIKFALQVASIPGSSSLWGGFKSFHFHAKMIRGTPEPI